MTTTAAPSRPPGERAVPSRNSEESFFNMGTLSPYPWDLTLWGKNGGCPQAKLGLFHRLPLVGPGQMPSDGLNLINHVAHRESEAETGIARLRHSRHRVGAQVASLRCLILRSAATNIAAVVPVQEASLRSTPDLRDSKASVIDYSDTREDKFTQSY